MTVPSQFTLHHFDRLVSTNQTLWEAIERGAVPGTAIIASEQSGGRGQWGRQWHSDRGGLYLSAYWQPNVNPDRPLQLTLCSAWGIAVALRDRGVPVALKWPNDLVLGDRKLGGILTETRVRQELIAHSVVGIGINWDNPVPETGINLTSFWQERQQVRTIASLDELAQIVLQGLARGWHFWQQDGETALLAAYNALLVNVGQAIEVGSQTGEVLGVAADGRLRVRLTSEAGENFPEISIEPGKISLGYNSSRSSGVTGVAEVQ
ncbi:MAG TPA: biotin--[acetyl-CoA-carboxylase] ligase [Oscillatoriales cyanobacterium M59_W2019_021]|nr:MAG: biotin--[acetyl-CoA-carboxylase] ligase [Cyanobacteria bacterium J055]HIK30183.1 biotin--[acetyl-CoA-carboxylase] ligase [Oscillatoriales cyanobacterium M4454_W2019_049]HIK52336.1 biotin--[acetyl-CoA-carboxylase] ligase [Oscillatoriales cyanobacterium M59_W2019_021]